MATKLLFPPTLYTALKDQKNPESFQSIRPFSFLPTNYWSCSNPNFRSICSVNSASIRGVKQDVIQSSDSETETIIGSNSSSTASSKLVLVVGGSGGVGKYNYFPLLLHYFLILPSVSKTYV